MRKISVEVFRFDPANDEKEKYETHIIPYREKMRVLDALFHIQKTFDGTLSFRWNCREGICGSCAMRVNGIPVLTCKTEVLESKLRIEPLKVFPLVKDLVADYSPAYRKAEKLKPWFTGSRKKGFWKIHDNEIQRVMEFRKCIDCYCCHDVCHVNRADLENYAGPRNFVKAMALDKHPKNTFKRAPMLKDHGIDKCNVTKCCTEVCPQNIRITDDAIIPTKELTISESELMKSFLMWIKGKNERKK